mmetsp:Transcript_28892/g.82148  ORF Transcript_28892/g.82148 Transcript_28892/m.82148 type:complete len:203 (+) Transcript_28892:321-929(+)
MLAMRRDCSSGVPSGQERYRTPSSSVMSHGKCECPKTCRSGSSSLTRCRTKSLPTIFGRFGWKRKRFSGMSSTRGKKCENDITGCLRCPRGSRRLSLSSCGNGHTPQRSFSASSRWASSREPFSTPPHLHAWVSVAKRSASGGSRSNLCPGGAWRGGSTSQSEWYQPKTGTTQTPAINLAVVMTPKLSHKSRNAASFSYESP